MEPPSAEDEGSQTKRMEIVPIEPRHFPRLAQIHASGMPESFLPRLGPSFLEELYAAMFASGAARGVVAAEHGHVVGFCYYTDDHASFFGRTLRQGSVRLAWRILVSFLRRPHLLGRILETTRYEGLSAVTGVSAEIYAWAVDPRWRRQRIGWRLLDAAESMMQAEGIRCYKHTVYEDNGTALDVYARRGHERLAEFEFYGKRWVLYRVDFTSRRFAALTAPEAVAVCVDRGGCADGER